MILIYKNKMRMSRYRRRVGTPFTVAHGTPGAPDTPDANVPLMQMQTYGCKHPRKYGYPQFKYGHPWGLLRRGNRCAPRVATAPKGDCESRPYGCGGGWCYAGCGWTRC